MSKKINTNKQLLDHMVGFVEHMFSTTGEIIPMWLMENNAGIIQPVITPFGGEASKEAVAISIRKIMKDFKAVRYGFMAEAWSLSLDKDHPDSKRAWSGDIMPSQHRDRREVVNLMVEDDQGGGLMGLFYILRPEQGPAKLSPFKLEEECEKHGGRFSGLLQKAV